MKQVKRLATTFFIIFDIYLFTGGYGSNSRLYHTMGKPLSDIIKNIADAVGGPNAIGWAIIILTAIIRLILLPIMLSQQFNTTRSQVKMRKLKPELDKVQAAVKNAKTQQEQQAASMASMSLYRENNISLTGGISWLTMFIQFPIFSGLYIAIRYTDGLNTATFFGLRLAHSQILLAAIVFAIYLLQAYLAQLHIPAEQKKMSGPMLWLLPVMLGGTSLFTSGALALYFIVGGLFALVQGLVSHLSYAKIEEEVNRTFTLQKTADELLQGAPAGPAQQNRVRPEDLRPKDVTETASEQQAGRNAGKQKRQ
ncbi:membrane protein insertase YidC [Leuconostocaceae bacterium ESL0958]|nr:membrane protein insertase YidC [Leuconostocaceae bacterium ESL0958]